MVVLQEEAVPDVDKLEAKDRRTEILQLLTARGVVGRGQAALMPEPERPELTGLHWSWEEVAGEAVLGGGGWPSG